MKKFSEFLVSEEYQELKREAIKEYEVEQSLKEPKKIMSYKEFINSERCRQMRAKAKLEEEKQPMNEGGKILSLASWALTRKLVKDDSKELGEKLAALVDLVAMSAFLNQKETKQLRIDMKRLCK